MTDTNMTDHDRAYYKCDKYNPDCRCYPRERPRTDANGLRTTVAMAIGAITDDDPTGHHDPRDLADAAIDAATPIIRAQARDELYDELIAATHAKALDEIHRWSMAITDWLEVPNWLRARKDAERE